MIIDIFVSKSVYVNPRGLETMSKRAVKSSMTLNSLINPLHHLEPCVY